MAPSTNSTRCVTNNFNPTPIQVTSFRVTEEGSNGVHMISLDSFGGRNLKLAKTERAETVVFLNGLRKALRMSAKPDHQRSGPSNNDAT